MKIRASLVFQNGGNSITNPYKGISLEELEKVCEDTISKIKNKLKEDEKISISTRVNTFKWEKSEHFENEFDDIRVELTIVKHGRSKYTERDIYYIVNSIYGRGAYFSRQ